MNPIHSFGIAIIQALQTMSPALDGLMRFFTFLGGIEFYLLLIPLIYWVVDAQLGVRLFFVLIFTDYLGFSAKLIFHQPRPYWLGGVRQLAAETSYGLPSGHSSNSLAVWGYLAYRVRKGWLWVLSCTVIVLIGVSRMYLAVHFPTDVLGGWLLGLAAIVLFVTGERLFLPRLTTLPLASQVGLGLGLSVAMILAGYAILALIAPFPDSAEWSQFSSEARSPAHLYTLAGALFGAVAGYLLMQRRGGFRVKKAWWQQGASYLLGITGVLLVYIGLDVLFSLITADETVAGYLLRYIRYGTVSFWAVFGAPWLFLKVGLADPLKRLAAVPIGVQERLA